MTVSNDDRTAPGKPLRLWPGIIAAILLVLVRFVLPIVLPEAIVIGMMGALVGALIILGWWLFFSRAPWLERFGAIVFIALALLVTSRIIHQSIRGGAMGMMFPIYAIPVLSLALVAGVVAGSRRSDGVRRTLMLATILLA